MYFLFADCYLSWEWCEKEQLLIICLCVPECDSSISKSCSRYEEGTCRPACNAEERLVDAKCPGAACQCCARPCTPRQSCVDAGGVCIEDQKDCKDGILDSDGCDGYKCMCCKPLSKEECPYPLCHKFVLVVTVVVL